MGQTLLLQGSAQLFPTMLSPLGTDISGPQFLGYMRVTGAQGRRPSPDSDPNP